MRQRFLFFFVLIPLFGGCNSVPAPQSFKEIFVEEKPKTPQRMAGFWNCYSQTSEDGSVLRGVGGRVLFYPDNKSKKPVKVDGEMTVFLFNAENELPELSKPFRQAIFKPETIELHYRKDDNGLNGYEFFIPVDSIDNEEMNLLVLAKFIDKRKGESISSSSTPLVLIGKPKTPKKSMHPESDFPEALARENARNRAGEPDGERDRNDGRRYGDERSRDRDDAGGAIRQVGYRSTKEARYPDEEDSRERVSRQIESITLPDYYTRALINDERERQGRSSRYVGDEGTSNGNRGSIDSAEAVRPYFYEEEIEESNFPYRSEKESFGRFEQERSLSRLAAREAREAAWESRGRTNATRPGYREAERASEYSDEASERPARSAVEPPMNPRDWKKNFLNSANSMREIPRETERENSTAPAYSRSGARSEPGRSPAPSSPSSRQPTYPDRTERFPAGPESLLEAQVLYGPPRGR